MAGMVGHEVEARRWLRCAVWQALMSSFVWLLWESLFSKGTSSSYFGLVPSLWTCLRFLIFQAAQHLFLLGEILVTSPQEKPVVSLKDLVSRILKLTWKAVIGSPLDGDASRELYFKINATRDYILFIFLCGLSGFMSLFSLTSATLPMKTLGGWYGMGLRGAVLGVLYALLHSYQKNSVLSFPIIQRGLFFSFKMGIRQILAKSVKLALAAAPVAELFVFVCSYSKNSIFMMHMRQMLWLQFVFVAGAFFTTLCWELCNHLIQVIHTRRHSFAPPLGSSAAESQPSETLLMVLEESASGSLSQHLAYLDLCNVAESNVDSWRRAAFFEETGETYKRVIGVCLRPLDNLSSRLAKGLEIFESDRSGDFLRQQLQVPGEDNKGFQSGIVKDVFRDFQLCNLCARTAVSLMACSRLEDRYGVAQLSGSNILVLSSLLSCLLAVEVYLGRRSSVKGIGIVGPNSIKWTVPSRGTSTEVTHWKGFPFGKGSAMHRKAYALADVLRTAIYQIVSVFGEEMVVGNSMSGKGFAIAERDWLSQKNPLYGTQEMHLQKLSMFLEYRA